MINPDSGNSHRASFPIVCIGMSAGAIQPLQILFRGVSVDTGMAFVVIHHLRKGHTHLPGILSRCTLIPVALAQAGLTLKPNHVYIISPGQEIGLTDGHFTSQPRTKQHGWPNVASLFLTSLTESQHRGVAVVLSGMGANGSAALTAFKQHNGITIAQAPDTASAPDMPLSAIQTGAVDFVMSPEEIPLKLNQIAAEFRSGRSA